MYRTAIQLMILLVFFIALGTTNLNGDIVFWSVLIIADLVWICHSVYHAVLEPQHLKY